MTREEAIRILDPETTAEALAEIEYYNGFTGKTAAVQAVSDACVLAISALREREERENPKPLTIEDLKQSEGRSVWWDWCGEYCLCKKEYVVTSNGTFSFNFVVNNGNAYRNKPKEE